jgi:hypothetical protein
VSDPTGDLSGGFDPERLSGGKPRIRADSAIVPDDVVRPIPASWSCSTISVRPIVPPGTSDTPPPGFNPHVLAARLP